MPTVIRGYLRLAPLMAMALMLAAAGCSQDSGSQDANSGNTGDSGDGGGDRTERRAWRFHQGLFVAPGRGLGEGLLTWAVVGGAGWQQIE